MNAVKQIKKVNGRIIYKLFLLKMVISYSTEQDSGMVLDLTVKDVSWASPVCKLMHARGLV